VKVLLNAWNIYQPEDDTTVRDLPKGASYRRMMREILEDMRYEKSVKRITE
jgi:hypothetical protein